jgi:uncharacterized protein (DUF302 family)
VKSPKPVVSGNQTVGIDLPLKALVFEDTAGTVWLSYNDPRWLAQRHGVGVAVAQIVDATAAAFNAVATKATTRAGPMGMRVVIARNNRVMLVTACLLR